MTVAGQPLLQEPAESEVLALAAPCNAAVAAAAVAGVVCQPSVPAVATASQQRLRLPVGGLLAAQGLELRQAPVVAAGDLSPRPLL